MRISEGARRMRARIGGYFWLPCPICGRMFGGFEIAETSLMDNDFSGWCVCRDCNDEAKRRNKESKLGRETIMVEG